MFLLLLLSSQERHLVRLYTRPYMHSHDVIMMMTFIM